MKAMLKYIRYSFSLLIILVGLFSSPTFKAEAAACSITSVQWIQSGAAQGGASGVSVRASVGEKVNLAIVGTKDCDGLVGNLNIYEKDSTPALDDFIRTLPLIFPSSSNNTNPNISQATTVIQFTQEDYATGGVGGGESGDEEMYVEASVKQGSSTTKKDNRSVPLILNKPSGNSQCQLGSAVWKWNFTSQPIVGSPVHLMVNGTGCSGLQVQLDIYEQDTGLGDDHLLNPLRATFNSAGTQAVADWKVDGSWDDDSVGSYEFYFYAAAGTARIKSGVLNNSSGIPLYSESGCLNCNALGSPDPVQCSDGTTQQRGTGQSGASACQGHIGDSHSDTPGGGGTNPDGGGTNPVPATPDKTYSFNITNPLNGGPNDLFDIIDIVTKWIMYISIPLAVLLIMYAGFLMLTAGPMPANFQKGRDVLKYTILGLAIIFIGKGFVSLIISIIELGGDSTPTTQQPTGGTGSGGTGTGGTGTGSGGLSCVNGQWSDGSGVCSAKCLSGVCQNGFSPAGWNNATKGLYVCSKDSDCVAHKAIGGLCAKTSDCNSGLKCQNTMCIRDTGNLVGEPCLNRTSCNQAASYACDNTNQASKTIDGRLVGSCYDIKNPNP